jgi:hypothetical protein
VVENPCVICPNGATAGDYLPLGADVGILMHYMAFMKQRAVPPWHLLRTPAPFAPMGSLSLMISPPVMGVPTLLQDCR